MTSHLWRCESRRGIHDVTVPPPSLPPPLPQLPMALLSAAGPAGSAGNHNSAAANSGRAASRGLLACRNLHEFLRGLEARALDRLYAHPAPCLALLRELSPLARNYVMRMLFLETPLPTAAIDSWVCKDAQKAHEESAQLLRELRVWQDHVIPGGLPGLVLNPIFRANLRTALLGGGNPWSDDTTGLGPDKHARDVTSLDRYALERWEVILHFMVGSPGAEVSADVAQLLLKAGLMRSETGEPPCITSAGFQFLLLDTASQVWYFMLQYLNSTETRGMDLVEILSFLFQLSFSTLGKDYSVEGMSESLLNFLQHLREFGMVFQRKRKSRRYYPTRLAINLASGISQVSTDVHQQGYLVVETNYRVYAYTDSELQVALVALFCEMLYRFPNLVVAQVTRESVQQAIANGITAEQIIHFLRTHAHPEMMKQTPVLPPTITDQIRLWEMERDRLVFTEGVLYSQFLSQADYEVLCMRAKELGVLQWECAARRLMVVTPAGHTDVKRFWKRQKNS